MTPQQKQKHAFDIYEKAARARGPMPQTEREIYYFLKAYWDALNSPSDPDEKGTLAEAARRFGVSSEEAKRAWEKVDGAGLSS